jgi:hypothetical protein
MPSDPHIPAKAEPPRCLCIPQPTSYDADGFFTWVRSLTGKPNPACPVHGVVRETPGVESAHGRH